MAGYAELIQCLDEELTEFGYCSDAKIAIPNIHYISYISSSNLLKTKNLCAVIDMPSTIIDLATAKSFFTFLKQCLLAQYGDAFLWKELEMCFIVLCDDKLYEILKRNEGKVASQASFSLSSLLGTNFVNKETFDNFFISTWGVYLSGDHIKATNEIVEQWCESQKAGCEG